MSLRAVRLDRNVKQEDLAAYIGVSPSMISRYERGLSIPPADKVVKMAEYLHTTVDSIMDYRRNVIDSDGIPTHAKNSFSSLNDDKVRIVTSEAEDIVLSVANGTCDLCGLSFPRKDFLETHYVIWLRDGGTPTPDNMVALCPNCHKLVHMDCDSATTEKLLLAAKKHRQ